MAAHLAACIRHAFIALLLLFLMSCGSGGGGEGGGTPVSTAAPTQTIVSGTVQAPSGAIAFFKTPSPGNFFASEAYAALTGLANVPDGTIVQLARLNATASSFSVITTTTTSGGRYSFNFTTLGLQLADDLIVRVAGPGGKEMRAFVIGAGADISPVSEAAYRLTIESLNGGVLSNLTLQELGDINGAVALIAMLQNVGNAISVDQAVELVRTTVSANAQVIGFLTAAAIHGQTDQGVGDIGDFYPFRQSNFWQYQVSTTSTFQSPFSYQTTMTVMGQEPAPVHGVNAVVIKDSNDEGENREEKTYIVKGVDGITSYGNNDPDDAIERALSPYPVVHFPLGGGNAYALAERSGLDWGDDVDGDNRNESFKATLLQTVLGIETVIVPAGTFVSCLKLERKSIFTVNFTAGGSAILTQTDTTWLAPGLGQIKSSSHGEIDWGNRSITVTEELIFYSVDGQTGGSGGPQPPPPPAGPTRIEISTPAGSYTAVFLNQTKQLRALAFGQLNVQFPGLAYTWHSSDPAILEVDGNGLIRGLNPGRATITATSNGLTSNALTFTVNNGKLISLVTNDIVYDKVSQKIFASIRSDSLTNPDTITVIDPATGNVGPFVPVGVQPNKLAISQDGQFLYVALDGTGAIRRTELPGLLPGPTFSLGTGTMAGCPTAPLIVDDMEVVPGSPLSVAVARKYTGGCSPWHFGVAVFDNGIQRSTVTPTRPLANIIEFSGSANTLYGLDGESSALTFTTMTLSSSGIALTVRLALRLAFRGH